MPTTVPPAELAAFSALGNTAVSSVPASVTAFTALATEIQDFAANPDLARAVVPDGGSGNAWHLLPADDSVCLTADAAGSCATLDDAAAGKLMWFAKDSTTSVSGDHEWSSDGVIEISGAAPDEFVTAVAIDENDDPVSTDVVDNVYHLTGDHLVTLRLVRANSTYITVPLT